MNTLTASQTTIGKSLPSNFGLLVPQDGYHLEVVVRATSYSQIYTERFCYVNGSYSPAMVYEDLLNREAVANENSKETIRYTLIDHKYYLAGDN